jgi:transcription initiation factor IIE alpha subunit
MPDEAKFRCGALYCAQCKKTFYYRMHILPGAEKDWLFKCPECGHQLGEVLTDAFIDSTEETLQTLQQLDEEFREGELD